MDIHYTTHHTPHRRVLNFIGLCLLITGLLTGSLLSCEDDPSSDAVAQLCESVTTTFTPGSKDELVAEINRVIAINNKADLNYIDTSEVDDMESLFKGKAEFNGDIRCWDVSKVATMARMFEGAESFNKDLSYWQPIEVTDMERMFLEATAFNSPLFSSVGKVQYMNDMFLEAEAFNQDISGWNISSVINTTAMFKDASSFCQNLGKWGDNLNPALNKGTMFVNTGTKCSTTFKPPEWYTKS